MAVPILNIDIPTKFSQAIKQTQVVKQQQEKYQYTKAIEEIKGSTLVKLETMNQEIKISEARANAEATSILSTA